MDDFEAFLSEQAEQHRMYPDDNVWRNIQNKLHGKDKWPALTFASIFTGAVITALLIFTHPNKEILNINQALAQLQEAEAAQSKQAATAANRATGTKVIGNEILAAVAQKRGSFTMAEKVPAPVREIAPVQEMATGSAPAEPVLTIANIATSVEERTTEAAPVIHLRRNLQAAISPAPASGDLAINEPKSLTNESAVQLQQTQNEKTEQIAEQQFVKTSLQAGPDIAFTQKVNRRNKWHMQFYATPSVSYRYLIDDQRNVLDPNAGPFAPFMTQPVNAFVRQRPRLGLEAGVAMLYDLSDNFRVKTGLQLNYRQFIINAYTGQNQPATVELNRGNTVQSIVQMTNISNMDGWRPIELNNQFLQLAIPLGFDLKMAELNKVDFYLSAAGQLTYQIASDSYMLSSDFKNYLQRPSDLERKFNVNTALEAFATFEAGGVQWQMGPQLRYQLLPGSKSAYPIREHLIDYGMKIGIIKQLK